MSRRFYPPRQPISAQLSTRRVKCPYCQLVFDHTDVLNKTPKVICKSCLKVFHTDTRDPHSTLAMHDPRTRLLSG